MKSMLKAYINSLILEKSPSETYKSRNIHVINSLKNDEIKMAIKNLLNDEFAISNERNQGNENITNIYIEISMLDSRTHDLDEICKVFNEKNGRPKEEVFQNFLEYVKVSVTITNSSIYIYGKYIKNSGNMSQTPMWIEGTLKYEKSVSDFTEYFKEHFESDNIKFIPSGREDADVTCKGRPFILEIIAPKKNIYNFDINYHTHEGVKLVDLAVVKKETKDYIFHAENKGMKKYKAKIFCKNGVIPVKTPLFVEILQKTPLRVLHRRANLTRKRNIEILELKIIDNRCFQIILKADAGAYIKEFVNSDFARTFPSISSIIGNFCDCIELEVIEVACKEINEGLILARVDKKQNENI